MAITNAHSARSIASRTGVSLGLVIGAVIVANLLGLGAMAGVGDVGPTWGLVLSLLATEAAFVAVAIAFTAAALDRSFVPVRVPTGAELRAGAVPLLAAVAVETGRQLGVAFTPLNPAGTVPIPDDPNAVGLVALVAVAVLIAPPAEEFLFRGVIQRYVREGSSVRVGVAVATLVFVPVHGLGILATTTSATAALATVATLVVVSVAVGVAYARTDNLAIPIVVHAAYNAATVVVGIAIAGL